MLAWESYRRAVVAKVLMNVLLQKMHFLLGSGDGPRTNKNRMTNAPRTGRKSVVRTSLVLRTLTLES